MSSIMYCGLVEEVFYKQSQEQNIYRRYPGTDTIYFHEYTTSLTAPRLAKSRSDVQWESLVFNTKGYKNLTSSAQPNGDSRQPSTLGLDREEISGSNRPKVVKSMEPF